MTNAPSTPAPAPCPSRLGKYELLRRLDRGGMAEIFLARTVGPEGFQKLLVIKRVLPELAADPETVRLFLNEARLAATLQHPNIAQVYDVGSADDGLFLAMEFVHGQSVLAILQRAAERKERVPIAEAVGILQGICAGLHHAHEKRGLDGRPLGIIHRDVSPANVLVTYEGCPKVVDFGIAKAAASIAAETRAGTVRGTVAYLSPEQCHRLPLDRRSDVFALGVVLYELTTTRRLFKGPSVFDVMRHIVEGPIPPPTAVLPGYPPALERIVLRALARDREARYPSAQELQLDLEAFALEHRLALSSVLLARRMETLFGAELAAWREAEREGVALADHLTRTMTVTVAGRRSTFEDDLTPPPPADAVAGDATRVDTGLTAIDSLPPAWARGAVAPAVVAPAVVAPAVVAPAVVAPAVVAPAVVAPAVAAPAVVAPAVVAAAVAAPAARGDSGPLFDVPTIPLERARIDPQQVEPARPRSAAVVWRTALSVLVLVGLGIALGTAIMRARRPAPTRPADAVQLQVVSEPAGAAVWIDGVRQALVTPSTYRAPRRDALGVRVELAGHRPHEQRVPFGRAEAARVLRVRLTPAEAPGVP